MGGRGIGTVPGAAAQQTSQGLQADRARGTGLTLGHPRVQRALRFVVAAATWTLCRALRQIGKVLDKGARVDVPEGRVIAWQAAAIVLWTTVITLLITGVIRAVA